MPRWTNPSAAPRKRGAPVFAAVCDPYVRWAIATHWTGFALQAGWEGPDDQAGPVRIIGHFDDAADIDRLLAEAQKQNHKLDIPQVYRRYLPDTKYRARFFTARTTLEVLKAFLLSNPLGLRWRLALEMRDTVKDASPMPAGLFGTDRDPAALAAANLMAGALRGVDKTPAKDLPGVIALIDHGCPFLNTQLAAADGGTRVAALWDQGTAAEPVKARPGTWPWATPPDFGVGRELGPDALGRLARKSRAAKLSFDETLVYRSIDYLLDPDDPRRRVWYATHGGHLLDVAAGWPDPLDTQRSTADPASEAALVFVQLPAAAALDSTGASLGAHLLDGVHYAMSVTAPDAPLVVNVSYGGNAGPHDGSSPIELALKELVEHGNGNLAIVLAAGNARTTDCHARREVRPNHSALLRVEVPPHDTTDSFVELWYALPPAGTELQLRVRTPERQWSDWTGTGDEQLLMAEAPADEVTGMLRHDKQVPNGKRAMALLAIAPTGQPDAVARSLAEPGIWEIEARVVRKGRRVSRSLPADTCVVVDAWIERDDAGRKPGTAPLRFVDQEPDDERGTLSSIASGERTFVVGGFNLGTRRSAPYSSLGFGGERVPHVLAACEQDEDSPTILAAATRSGERVRLRGTSVAAPVFARRLYNELVLHQKLPLANEEAWKQALQAVLDEDTERLLPFSGD